MYDIILILTSLSLINDFTRYNQVNIAAHYFN